MNDVASLAWRSAPGTRLAVPWDTMKIGDDGRALGSTYPYIALTFN